MVEIAAAFTHAARAAANMMVSPIPRKFPDIKLVWSEGGIGWITAAIERADRQWERHQYWTHVPDADVLPSEVARRNMWFCMIEEPVGLTYRHDFTVDHIVCESDYPHSDTTFPSTQDALKGLFEGVPARRGREDDPPQRRAPFRLSLDRPRRVQTSVSYQPLAGVKVLDLGILIPAALTSGKLAALGADVVKVEQPPNGDRLRVIPPIGDDGESPQHMSQSWGKRSIGLDVRDSGDRAVILALAGRADIIVENQLAGFWAGQGIDFAALRRERPALIVCSVTGFGQTGPWASLPSHGLNMDALADTLPVEWEDGQPHRGRTFTSWGNELGTAFAAMAILAALVAVRTTGEGAWIDLSCWDALVEAHRADIAITERAKRRSLCSGWGGGSPFTTPTCPATGCRCCSEPSSPSSGSGSARTSAARTSSAVTAAPRSLSATTTTTCAPSLRRSSGKRRRRSGCERFIDWDVPGRAGPGRSADHGDRPLRGTSDR